MSDRRSRKQRACLMCGKVKTFDEFVSQGCENCEDKLHLRGDQLKVEDCTTTNFEGLIGLMQPENSWVARWQHISKGTEGMYAIKVNGELPEEYQ